MRLYPRHEINVGNAANKLSLAYVVGYIYKATIVEKSIIIKNTDVPSLYVKLGLHKVKLSSHYFQPITLYELDILPYVIVLVVFSALNNSHLWNVLSNTLYDFGRDDETYG